jgi:hypothetical protein
VIESVTIRRGRRDDGLLDGLWPEPGATPIPKDALENRLNARVCDHEIALAAAQLAIAGNWVAAYDRYLR